MKPLVADLSSINRKFGIEIEFGMPMTSATSREQVQSTLASVLSANGLPTIARGYNRRPIPHEYVLASEYDATVAAPAVTVGGDRITGISFANLELKTTILRSLEEFERIVPKAIGIARSMGGKPSGGLHIHVGVTIAGNSSCKSRA